MGGASILKIGYTAFALYKFEVYTFFSYINAVVCEKVYVNY